MQPLIQVINNIPRKIKSRPPVKWLRQAMEATNKTVRGIKPSMVDTAQRPWEVIMKKAHHKTSKTDIILASIRACILMAALLQSMAIKRL